MHRSRVALLVTALTLVGAACSSIGTVEDPFGPNELVTSLQARGATVSIEPWPYETPIVAVTGDVQLLCIDRREMMLAVYPTTSARTVDANDAPPRSDAEIDLDWGAIGWWARGRVLISMVYLPEQKDAVADTLDAVLGPILGWTLTGRISTSDDPPQEVPSSKYCG